MEATIFSEHAHSLVRTNRGRDVLSNKMAAMKLCLMLLASFTLYSCVSQWKTVATLSKSDKKKTRDSSASVCPCIAALSYTVNNVDVYVRIVIFTQASHLFSFLVIFIQVKDVVLTVADRGLISEKITWKSIAENHKLYSKAHTSEPQFSGNVLGYVTPVS